MRGKQPIAVHPDDHPQPAYVMLVWVPNQHQDGVCITGEDGYYVPARQCAQL